MESKKISLAEATKEYVYSDVYGFVNSKVNFSIVARVVEKDRYGRTIDKEVTLNQDSVFLKKNDSSFAHLSNMELLDVFKLELYARKDILNNNYYGYSNSYSNPRENEVSKLDKIKKIILKWEDESVEGAPNNKKAITEFLSKEVYEYSDDFNKSEYLYDYEIKEKQFVRYNQGTCQVVEVYPQPNKENKLCQVCSYIKGYVIDVPCSTYISGKQQQTSRTLYKVPYERYPKRINELGVFDSELCEFKLNPLFEKCKDGDRGNLYWQPIEEAASYKVSLYKYRFEEFVEKKLYLLEEFEIDRNKHWLTIDNLYGENYIIRLTAENRNGMPIAISRGIPVKFAGRENKVQWWTQIKNGEKKEQEINLSRNSGSWV